MQNRDHDHAGTFRRRPVGLLGVALVAAAFLLAVPAAMAAPGSTPAAFASVSPDATDRPADKPAKLELAGKEHRDSNYTKPPQRGSSAELNGGSSADRYGGSSADRRGVAGRYDPRNRSVRQFSGGSRKRGEPRSKKHNDELDDQDQDPPQDRYTFSPPDPGQARDRSDRD